MAYHADARQSDDVELLTWDGFGAASRELASQVADSGFRPEVIVAIARGGLALGGALSYALGVKLADTINVEYYTDDARSPRPDPILLAPMLDGGSIVGRQLLVVDDVVDTGRTLGHVTKLLRGFGAEVRTATLFTKPNSVVRPDFAWLTTDRWIVFPWAVEPPVV